jgi:hypothetical protein
MRSLPVLLIAFFILAVSETSSALPLPLAQADTGVIKGVVLDPQGAVVAGANIRGTLNKTGAAFTTTSGDDGSFVLGALPFGDYSVLISAPGFAKFNTQVALTRDAAETAHNATLQVAMGEVSINVHMIYIGDGATVCVVCGYTYFSFTFADLPLKNREPESLVALQPGVAMHNGGFSIAGRRMENKTSLLDGFDNRDPATGLTSVSLSIDSLAEFNSQYTNADTGVTSNYGQNGAPLLASTSKSGSNQYHGQGFWHLNRTGLNANNFFTNRGALPRDEAFFDQAGFTLAGTPSVPGLFSAQDRAFFFVSYEHARDRQRSGRQIIAPLESFVERTAAIQGPLFRSLLARNRIPLATATAGASQDIDGDGLADIGAAAARNSRSLSRDLALGRFDLRLTDHFQLELFYASDRSRALDDFNEFGFTPASPLETDHRGDLTGLQFTALISPSSVNDFRVGYLRSRTSLSGAGSDAPQLVALNTPVGVGGGVPEVPERRENRALIFADTFTRSAGAHTIRTGAQLIRRKQLYVSDALAQGRIYYSDALALITDGTMSTGDPLRAIVRAELAQSSEREQYRFTDVYLFAHDDWRASPRFVINYGLGYSLYSAAIYRTKTDRNNFAPFVSFAYAPTHSESFIIRGGAAIIYAPPTLLPYGEIKGTPPYPVATGFATSREIVASPLPHAWSERDGAVEVESEFSSNLRTAYTESAFFAIQQSISDRLIIEVGYNGLFGHRLTQAYRNNRSRLDEPLASTQDESDQERVLIASDGNSSYHSLQVRVTSRERRRLTFQTHYTFSKAIDTASADRPTMFRSLALGPVFENSAALERGPSDFDRRHRAVGFFQWRGPSLDRFSRTGRVMFGDWRVSGIVTIQSGAAVSLYSGGDFFSGLGDFNGDGVLNDRVAYLGTGPLRRAIQQTSPADGYFDSRMFGAPGVYGRQPLGRNLLPAPGYGSLDLAVHKKISISEVHAIEVRADVFNAANRVNFAPPVSDFANAYFGRSIEAGPARTIRLAVKYVF